MNGPISVVMQNRPPITVAVSTGQGPSGPPGPSGPRGLPGSSSARYEHQQLVVTSTWTVNHNLGYKPAVTPLNTGGLALVAEVLHISLNQVYIYFDQPLAGSAICN